MWPDDERTTGVTWPLYHPMPHMRRSGFEAVVSSGLVPEPTATEWNSLANDMVWSVALETGLSTLRPLAQNTDCSTPVSARLCES